MNKSDLTFVFIGVGAGIGVGAAAAEEHGLLGFVLGLLIAGGAVFLALSLLRILSPRKRRNSSKRQDSSREQ